MLHFIYRHCLQLLLCCFGLALTACSEWPDVVDERLQLLEQRVDRLETATEALRRAYENGKIIRSVTPIAATATTTAGQRITFSDNSFIDIHHGQKGDKGEQGEQGIMGEKGETGAQGEVGPPGLNGADGRDGQDGRDGLTPYVKIDSDGFWAVSYDEGASWSRLIDAEGNFIRAQGPKGDKGEQGEQGIAGEQGQPGTDGQPGKDGANGLSVRVVVGADGNYAFEAYDATKPELAVSTTPTPYSANPTHHLRSITTDETNHRVVITMADGQQFNFPQFVAQPTSIAILATAPVRLAQGSVATIDFRVNPSNAAFDYKVLSDHCQLFIDRVGLSRASNYVTSPTAYRLANVELIYDAQGVQRQGHYHATIEDLNSGKDYADRAALVVQSRDANGEEVYVSSSAFVVQSAGDELLRFALEAGSHPQINEAIEAVIEGDRITLTAPTLTDFTALRPSFTTNAKVFVGDVEQQSGESQQDFTKPVVYRLEGKDGTAKTYTVTVRNTGLPIVRLTTPTPITSKDDWTQHCTMRIEAEGNTTDYGSIEMRGRGNTTWFMPKKPYALRLGKRAEVLGMPAHKRWVLLANWLDRTLLRNEVGLELARQTSLAWTPSGRFVEVELNGRYVGNYYLCEQIRVDKHRLDLQDMRPEDVEGDAVTGGYLLEFDKYYDEDNKFRTAHRDLPCNIKEPDGKLQPQQLAYIEQYVNKLEEELYKNNAFAQHDYLNYLDLQSTVDYFLACEVAGQSENFAPKSVYAYKDRGQRLHMGPVWDFDYGTFRLADSRRFVATYGMWMQRLVRDRQFWRLVKERWTLLRPRFLSVVEHIEKWREPLRLSNEANLERWPIYERVNGDEAIPYDAAIDRLIEALRTKIAWLDGQIKSAA